MSGRAFAQKVRNSTQGAAVIAAVFVFSTWDVIAADWDELSVEDDHHRFVYNSGEIETDGAWVSYTHVEGDEDKLPLVVYVTTKGSSTYTSTTRPSIGLGMEHDDWKASAKTQNGKGSLDIRFKKGTRHGRLDIRRNDEEVEVSLQGPGSRLRLSDVRRETSSIMSVGGRGYVQSGSVYIAFTSSGRVEIREVGRGGATPFRLRIDNHSTEYSINRNGTITKRRM